MMKTLSLDPACSDSIQFEGTIPCPDESSAARQRRKKERERGEEEEEEEEIATSLGALAHETRPGETTRRAPLAQCARTYRTVHLGSMPSSVRRRCSVLYVFSPYLLLSLFLPTQRLSAARLVPGLYSAARILGRTVLREALGDAGAPPRDDRGGGARKARGEGAPRVGGERGEEGDEIRSRARDSRAARAIIPLIKLNVVNSKGEPISDVFA